MIRTFGLFWHADRVDWGMRGPGNAGSLMGTRDRGNSADAVDFRPQHGIYALYSDFELVYVGQTGGNAGLLVRLRKHLSDHLADRWDRFSWFGTKRVLASNLLAQGAAAPPIPPSVGLDAIEAVAIAIAEPRLNLKRGNWSAAEAQQYFQIPAQELSSTET